MEYSADDKHYPGLLSLYKAIKNRKQYAAHPRMLLTMVERVRRAVAATSGLLWPLLRMPGGRRTRVTIDEKKTIRLSSCHSRMGERLGAITVDATLDE